MTSGHSSADSPSLSPGHLDYFALRFAMPLRTTVGGGVAKSTVSYDSERSPVTPNQG